MSSLVGTSLFDDDVEGGGGVPPRRGPRPMRSESPSSTSAVSRPRSYVVAKSRAASLLNARAANLRSPTRMPKDAVDRAPRTSLMTAAAASSGGVGSGDEEEWARIKKEKMRRSRITSIETAAKRILADNPGISI